MTQALSETTIMFVFSEMPSASQAMAVLLLVCCQAAQADNTTTLPDDVTTDSNINLISNSSGLELSCDVTDVMSQSLSYKMQDDVHLW